MSENENRKDEVTETEPTEPSLDELKAKLEKLESENAKLKSAQSNASADASKYKKQLQERMSEQERAAAETKDLIERLQSENEKLKRDQTLAEYTTGFLSVGYSEDLARKAAEATLDGKFAEFISAHKTFVEEHDKAKAAESIRNMSRPGNGGSSTSVTKEQFAKMGYSERAKLFEEQPELYKELNT